MKLEDSSFVQCTSCKLIQMPDSCKTQWYLRIMVTHDDVNYPMKKIILTPNFIPKLNSCLVKWILDSTWQAVMKRISTLPS